jgi:arylsulfatase A-like enzyme
MSDNGAFRLNRTGFDVGINDPLRHGGVTCWEGGLRVAAMARWPHHIRPGSVISQPFWSPDLLVACARLADARLPTDVVIDGKNPLPLLTADAKSPHASFYFSFRKHSALRKGDWKIVREKPNAPWQLFHLANDLPEAQNLASTHPRRVVELQAEFERWEAGF